MSDEIFAVTQNLTVEDLIRGYDIGVFPWPHEDLPHLTPWFSPLERGVLFFDRFHIPRSTKKMMRKKDFRVTFCQNFPEVIKKCAEVKRNYDAGTWINPEIIEKYTELFKRERAYSVEVWNQHKLVGGLYGVIAKGYVSGESMFFEESGASKVALIHLVRRLEGLGLSYLDTQMVSPVVESFGGITIPRERFVKMILGDRILTDSNSTFFKELSS